MTELHTLFEVVILHLVFSHVSLLSRGYTRNYTEVQIYGKAGRLEKAEITGSIKRLNCVVFGCFAS